MNNTIMVLIMSSYVTSLAGNTWDLPYNLSIIILCTNLYCHSPCRDAGTNTKQNGCGSCTMVANAQDKLCEGKQWRYNDNYYDNS